MIETVLITGASRGIGRETARLFARKGYRVVINYRHSEAAAAALEAELNQIPYPTGQQSNLEVCRPHIQNNGPQVHNGRRPRMAMAYQADVGSPQEVAAMFSAVQKAFGGVDILVNNAGIAQQKLFQDITEADWDEMFRIHVKGMFHCCQAAVPQMIRRKKGAIINLSSIWGICGASCEVHYAAAKGAVIAYTKALAKELGPSGITVNCVAPGIIDTEMNRALSPEILHELAAETPAGRLGTPEEIAQVIYFLASREASFLTGQVISPNGGFLC